MSEATRMNPDSYQARAERMMDQTGEAVRDVGSRVDANLQSAKAALSRAQEAVSDQARYAADYTDQYVHENPWKSIGFAAVVGLLIGVLISNNRR